MKATKSQRFNPFSLDAVNFLLADVRGALGPYLNVFLLTQQLAGIAVLTIPAQAIDFDRARDLDGDPAASAATAVPCCGVLFTSRLLVVFGLCVMLFHFANAPLLPLVGQKLAAYPKEATAMMSACIVAAQAVMLPIALLAGRTADSWGRKLIGVQVFDGVGAGIFGAPRLW